MANKARRSFGRRVGVRRATVWLSTVPQETTITGGTGAVLLTSLSAAGKAFLPFTVVRTVGMLYISSDQVANSETQFVAYGAAVVSEQAVAIGITAIPTPITDIDSDLWFAYQTAVNATQVASSIGMGFAAGTAYPFDSRAMRKVDEGEDVVTVLETAGISDGVVVRSTDRILVKLH